MGYEEMFQIVKGDVMVQLTRFDTDPREWQLTIYDKDETVTAAIFLNRDEIRDLMTAFEREWHS